MLKTLRFTDIGVGATQPVPVRLEEELSVQSFSIREPVPSSQPWQAHLGRQPRSLSRKVNRTTHGTLTADAHTFVQPVSNQDAATLMSLFSQPNLLKSGEPYALTPNIPPYPPVYGPSMALCPPVPLRSILAPGLTALPMRMGPTSSSIQLITV